METIFDVIRVVVSHIILSLSSDAYETSSNDHYHTDETRKLRNLRSEKRHYNSFPLSTSV